MNDYFNLYLLTRLDYIQNLFIAACVITGALCIIYTVGRIEPDWNCNGDEESPKNRKARKLVYVLFSLFVTIACLIPSKNEAILIMVGGKTMNFVQKDSSLNKIPGQTTAIISAWLDKELKEAKK